MDLWRHIRPGWYPDYARPSQLRYWDGLQWTEFVHLPDSPDSKLRRPKFHPSSQLIDATYRMLFADRMMIVLLFAGSVAAAAVAGAVLYPAMSWAHITPGWSGGGVLGVLVAAAGLGAASFVIQLVTGAVIAAAMLQAEGRPATVRAALRLAWRRRRQLLAWALVSTLVGALIRTLERSGLGGLIASLTLSLGWAFATVFAIPVVMVEGTMPLTTMRRSAELVRRRFAVTLISTVKLAVPWIALACAAVTAAVVGAFTVADGHSLTVKALGVVLAATGAVGLCLVLAVSSALSAYLQTMLYRYAVDLPVPGVDRSWLPPLRPS